MGYGFCTHVRKSADCTYEGNIESKLKQRQIWPVLQQKDLPNKFKS